LRQAEANSPRIPAQDTTATIVADDPALTAAAWLRAGEDAELSARALVAQHALANLPSFPAARFEVQWLADKLRVGSRQARRLLAELDDRGLLEREECIDPKWGQRANFYKCTVPDIRGHVRARNDCLLCFGVVVDKGDESLAFDPLDDTPPRTFLPDPLRSSLDQELSETQPQSACAPVPVREGVPPADAPEPAALEVVLAEHEPPEAPEGVKEAGTALALAPDSVAVPPALLAGVLREHGPDAARDVLEVMRRAEARANPRAALGAVVMLAQKPRSKVQAPRALCLYFLRGLADGTITPPRSDGSGFGAMRRLQDKREEAEQDGRLDEAGRLREIAHRSTVALKAAADRLELQDPTHQLIERIAESCRDAAPPKLPAPAPRALPAPQAPKLPAPATLALPPVTGRTRALVVPQAPNLRMLADSIRARLAMRYGPNPGERAKLDKELAEVEAQLASQTPQPEGPDR
jgi:hypothetical protein